MRTLLNKVLVVGGLAAGAATAPPPAVVAPWVREAPPGTPVWAAYMTVRAGRGGADTLLSVRSDAFARVEMHRMTVDHGMARMQPIHEVRLPAGGEFKFAPGGSHLMLYDPRRPLKAGDRVGFTLKFARSGEVRVSAPVRAYRD